MENESERGVRLLNLYTFANGDWVDVKDFFVDMEGNIHLLCPATGNFF